jgi:hypothetical protein
VLIFGQMDNFANAFLPLLVMRIVFLPCIRWASWQFVYGNCLWTIYAFMYPWSGLNKICVCHLVASFIQMKLKINEHQDCRAFWSEHTSYALPQDWTPWNLSTIHPVIQITDTGKHCNQTNISPMIKRSNSRLEAALALAEFR